LVAIWKKAYYNRTIICLYERGKHCSSTKKLQLATFAAGCFWGVEEAFRERKGVKSTIVGYTGGWFNNPTYRDVCTDKTGHAEAVQVQFDPNEVSYEDLLDIFWYIHNPTTKNRQGPEWVLSIAQ
jgi:peptide-methionine (S)-S-oxide reductase